MSTQRIKLIIASRHYPLTIASEDEELVRNAAKEINETIRLFEEKYAVTDKQDVLAMVAIQYAIKDFKWQQKAEGADQIPNNEIERLIERIDHALAKK
ncbi:cell division protein ZapA [Vaginella massiliensis]|uniref:cell division protein ZapA n=1 Tax=Vaginella massiliensis TaxID=1816680 RepID=UPI000839A753|nr:cell division protein ZapA [Vaginella massiliensis]